MTQAREIIDRLRLHFPLRITLSDVISGEPYVLERDNLIAMLVIDAGNALLETQTVAPFYAEMARAHAAAKLMAGTAQMELKRWKAQRRAECRRVAEKAKEKPPSKDLQDDFYRNHDEYPLMNQRADQSRAISELLGDLKEAFQMKQWGLRDIHAVVAGHNRVEGEADRGVDRAERLEELVAARDMMDRAAAEMQAMLGGEEPSAGADDDGPSCSEPPPKAATTKSGKQPRRPAGKGDK